PLRAPTALPYTTLFRSRRAGLRPGRDFRIIDQATEPGGAWRSMWPGMRLISPAPYSSLPGMPMPPWTGDGTPDPAHVVGYLSERSEEHTSELQSRFDLV